MKNYMILILAGMFFITSCTSQSSNSEFEIKKGSFKASVFESGELQAVNAVSINMPSIGYRYGWQFKIIDLVKNGDIVKKGDRIAKIDQTSVRKRIIEMENELNSQEGDLNKQLIQASNKTNGLKTKLEEEQANYDLKKLEVETFKFESPRKRNVKELEFEQVIINRKRAISNIKRERIIIEYQTQIQRIRVDQIKLNIELANEALKKLDVISPIDGIVQLRKNRRSGQKYKVGDELHNGQSFALVPNIKYMKVKTFINEMDYKKIQLGQAVNVRLDALPNVTFKGTLNYLGKLSKPKERESKVKVFDAEVMIIDNDERLKPGMTVSCEIIYADLEDVFYVNNECLLREDGKYYLFFKKNKRKEVKVGFSNNKYTLILDKVKKGQDLFRADRAK